jgi:hypothetical protein
LAIDYAAPCVRFVPGSLPPIGTRFLFGAAPGAIATSRGCAGR